MYELTHIGSEDLVVEQRMKAFISTGCVRGTYVIYIMSQHSCSSYTTGTYVLRTFKTHKASRKRIIYTDVLRYRGYLFKTVATHRIVVVDVYHTTYSTEIKQTTIDVC
jgi:hypothetical protein